MKASREDKEISAMQEAYGALRDLDQKVQARVLEWLAKKLGVDNLTQHFELEDTSLGRAKPSLTKPQVETQIEPKAFLTAKKPANVVERVTCLAYYLTHYRGVKQFKTSELTKLNTDASQPKLSNPAFFARNATSSQYLSLAGGGKKQITARGEALVDALPDRAAVGAALKNHPVVGRKATKPRSAKKK